MSAEPGDSSAADSAREDRALRHALRLGAIEDERFDALYPPEVRAVSGVFWTPLRVAFRAAELLEEHGASRVLDVGAGAGKFCLAAAFAGPSLTLTGIEHRPHLVEVARSAARRLRLENVRFEIGSVGAYGGSGALGALEWSGFDGFYFFNPFAENRFDAEDRYDETVELSPAKSAADVLVVERRLSAARAGTAVVTYHGFGGRVPRSFRLARSERCGTDWLNVWIKDAARSEIDGFWFEYEDEDTGAPIFLERPIALASV